MKLVVIALFIILIVTSCFDFGTLKFKISNLAYFIDLPSLIIVLVPTIVFAIGSYSWNTYVKTWSVPFGDSDNNEQSELVEVNKCLNFMGNMSLVMGIIRFY